MNIPLKLCLVLGAAPGIFWLVSMGVKRSGRPGLLQKTVKVFVLGCVFTVPAILIESAFGASIAQRTFSQSVFSSFFVIAPVEELFKLLAVWFGAYHSDVFRRPLDGLLFSTTCALGFASVENAIHIGRFGSLSADAAPTVLLLRWLFATPAHVMFAAAWGYALGRSRFQASGELWTVAAGYLAAVVLHGAYDSIVAYDPAKAVLSLLPLMAVMLAGLIWTAWKSGKALPYTPLERASLVVCPVCGAYVSQTEALCERCGCDIPRYPVDSPRLCGKCRAYLSPDQDLCPQCGEVFNPDAGAAVTRCP